MTSVYTELEVIFARKSLRMTTPRQLVFESLRGSEMPLAIGDIIKKCPSIDRVSIYRTIELFGELGIVEVVPTGWKQRYELTSPFKSHHHHLYCTNCHKLIDIHSKRLEQLVASIAKESGFIADEHKFEVSGLCNKCSKSN
jgi:Fur family ferric uptake transcriptional regulator